MAVQNHPQGICFKCKRPIDDHAGHMKADGQLECPK